MKILLADSNAARRETLAAQLVALDADFSVTTLESGASLLAEVQRQRPDVVLVDMGRPDRDCLEAPPAPDGTLPVVMFLDDADPGFMQEAIGAGLSSYHAQKVAPDAAKLVMRLALTFFQRNQAAASALKEMQDQAALRQTIDAAKRLLIKEENMSEPAAHRFLRRRAMDQQKRLADVASELLAARAGKGAPHD